MINRFIRNFLNGQHIICKVQQVQAVHVTFLHHCNKNSVCPTAVLSCGARMASSSSSRPSQRSKLLDAYRNNRTANLQLADLGKDAVAFALDPLGSRFIEQKLEHANPTEKAQLVDALRGHVLTLALHKSGCHVIEKALKSVDKASQIEIIDEISAQVTTLSLHEYGNWVIQHVLEHCTEQQKRPVLQQLLDNVPTLVTDKYGSFVIRHVIEHGRLEDRERIVRSLQGDNARQLMADEFGSFVIQKFFECGTEDQKAQLVDALRGHVLELALQIYGGPVIQTALKSVDKASQMEIIEELTPRSCVIRCIKDQYGSHVMDMIFELIEPQRLQFVVDAILSSPSDSVASLSVHEYGSRVIERVLEHCTEQQKRPVLEQLLDIVPTLATDKYGSFVIELVIEHGLPEDREPIVRSLHENVLCLVMDKHGSHLIQRVLEHCTEQQKRPVLEQLLDDVPALVTDQYGSFLIEYVIEHGRPEDRERIVRSLQGDILKNTYLHSFCSVIKKCLTFGTTEQKNALIDQVCADDGTGKTPLLQMMKQQFAKDVVLKMVDGADSAHRDKMMFAIEEHIPALLKKQQLLAKSGGAVADKRKKPNNG